MGRKSAKRRASVDDDSGSEAGAPVAKRSKSGPSASTLAAPLKDSDGNTYWELPKTRRVTVSEFNNRTLVNIREYYEKDGKTLPGKKGISLSIDQYRALLRAVPGINAELRRMTGQDLDDPNGAGAVPAMKAVAPLKQSKSNIDTTSEEED